MALSLDRYRSPYWFKEEKINAILTKRIERQRKSSPKVSFKNGIWMSEQILLEILSRLPVKDLLQFKIVCNLWYDLIKSPHFISKHLENCYNNQSYWRECLIIQYAVTQAGELNVYELLVDNKKNRVLSYQEISTPVYNTYMCGPCNGIYYLWCFCIGPKRSFWNPALNEFEVLPNIISKPNLPSFVTISSYEVYGFGFDAKTMDYKVVVILSYHDARDVDIPAVDYEDFQPFRNTFSVFIYSLRSNSWRYWGDLKNYCSMERSKSYDFINGCYYWIGSRQYSDWGWNYDTIISFDFANDELKEIPIPEFEVKPQYGTQLMVFDNTVAFVCVPENRSKFCVWSWKDEVWTQMLTMELDFNACGAFSQWRDNTLIFKKSGGKLILCDTNTKETWMLNDPQAGGVETICAYKESLVSIKDFKLEAQQEVNIIESGLINILSVKLYCDGLL